LSKVGDTIIDTFGGGGTTAIASYKLKRKIITCEVDEITNNIAKKRFKKECDGK
jgi:DNA modification methylase